MDALRAVQQHRGPGRINYIVAQRGMLKTASSLTTVVVAVALHKPGWIRVRLSRSETYRRVKQVLWEQGLNTVCEEAACPNIGECFTQGATFMVLGALCARRCSFCDVAHGRPLAPDPQEPLKLAETVARFRLNYVVVTSVDRDDPRDGGAAHFAACIRAERQQSPRTRIEILTPAFRGRLEAAWEALATDPSEVMNHNLETVPRLYREARPGADYAHSLALLRAFKQHRPKAVTKSGLMLGLGETDIELLAAMRDLRAHDVDMLTVEQYLQPRPGNLTVRRYVTPEAFDALAAQARQMDFTHAVCGPLVRSSYHSEARAQAAGAQHQPMITHNRRRHPWTKTPSPSHFTSRSISKSSRRSSSACCWVISTPRPVPR
jgi:lipoic acid synthetase